MWATLLGIGVAQRVSHLNMSMGWRVVYPEHTSFGPVGLARSSTVGAFVHAECLLFLAS